MKITDKKALQELKRANSFELWESIESYPEDEREGRTDLQMVFNECCYILERFDDEGSILFEDMEWAKEVLKNTKNGKVIPLYPGTMQAMYRAGEVEAAKGVVNQFRRLKALKKRLCGNPEIW